MRRAGLFLALAGLLSARQWPSTLIVRAGDVSTPLPVLVTRRGPMVRLEDGLEALGGALMRNGSDTYRLIAGGADVEFTVGVAVARLNKVASPATRAETDFTRAADGRSTYPLSAPPSLFEGKLLVPLALLTDLLPRVAVGYGYDAGRGVLSRESAPPQVPRQERATPMPAESPPARAAPPRRRDPSPRLVVVDAGHGGPDRGMQGPIGSARKVFEKDITLGVAREVRAAMERRGIRVVMTRDKDTLIALNDRGRIANRAGASLFVSIHVNAANPRWQNPGGARGYETYFLSEAKSDDERRVEALENEAARYDGEEEIDPNDPLSFILNDMKQNEYLRESSDLAAVVQRGLGQVHPGPSRGVKQAGFIVLNRAYMPAVLVEIGFGSNAAEVSWLGSGDGQRTLGESIAQSVATYLERLERKTQGGAGR
jgi:N-acetylmuramoyl-L-alanine amidase